VKKKTRHSKSKSPKRGRKEEENHDKPSYNLMSPKRGRKLPVLMELIIMN
jgi:hypothetical protein